MIALVSYACMSALPGLMAVRFLSIPAFFFWFVLKPLHLLMDLDPFLCHDLFVSLFRIPGKLRHHYHYFFFLCIRAWAFVRFLFFLSLDYDWWPLRGLLSPVDIWLWFVSFFLSIYLRLYCWAFYPFSLEPGLCISRTRSSKIRAWAWEEFGWRQNLWQHNSFRETRLIFLGYSVFSWFKSLYPT